MHSKYAVCYCCDLSTRPLKREDAICASASGSVSNLVLILRIRHMDSLKSLEILHSELHLKPNSFHL